MKRVYFDNAATTALDPEVLKSMQTSMSELFGNPSSIHAEGRKVRAAIEAARKTVAECIGASIGEVFFTSGGTESNNMALKCAVRDQGVRRIISSPIEHHCVLHSLENLEQHHEVQVEYVQVDNRGRVDYLHLESLLAGSNSKTLVTLMHANNEVGTLLDMERVATLCEQYNALLHSDTVQTVGHFPVDVSKTKIHYLSGAAHKFHGPKGVGFIYINGDNQLKPFIDGGSQERNMRGGTENVYGIIGLAKALELATVEMESRRAHIDSIRSYAREQLEANIPNISFRGDYDGDYLYTVLSVAFPPSAKSDLLLLSLDIAGICASGGSACSSGAEVQSHVVTALGTHQDYKTIRFSFSHYNDKSEVDYLVEQLQKILMLEPQVS